MFAMEMKQKKITHTNATQRFSTGNTMQRQKESAPGDMIYNRLNKTGLPDRLKSNIESLSGLSMDDVRVHYNSPKPTQFQALAFTQGEEIHVAPGQIQHLPHEAWHVVQQKQGRVNTTALLRNAPINDNPLLEHEADVMGQRALQGKFLNTHLQRKKAAHANVQMKEVENRFKKSGLDLNNSGSVTSIKYKFIDPNDSMVIESEKTDIPDDTNDNYLHCAEVETKVQSAGDITIDKQEALKQISAKAGGVGNAFREKLLTGELAEKKDFLVVEFGIKYKTRNGFLAGNVNKEGYERELKLTYHYGKAKNPIVDSGDGYVIKVEKNSINREKIEKENTVRKGSMIESREYSRKEGTYSSTHDTSRDCSILEDTYMKNYRAPNSGAYLDAYTKLAGEGARFECVRENMERLTNNTIFYFNGVNCAVSFNDLWQMWNEAFHKQYNIPNIEIKEFLSEDGKRFKFKNNMIYRPKTADAKKDDGDEHYYRKFDGVKFYYVDHNGNKCTNLKYLEVNCAASGKLFLQREGQSYKWTVKSVNKRKKLNDSNRAANLDSTDDKILLT